LETGCPGAQYLRINSNGKMEECVYYISGFVWVELPLETINGKNGQKIHTLSIFPTPDKTNDMNNFCECFIDLDPTNSIERVE
jgi:hypothetical protein